MDEQSLGVGLGLRPQHLEEILRDRPKLAYFEVLVDNYFAAGEKQLKNLEKIAENYPLCFHSVGLNLGSSDLPNKNYLKKYKNLIARFKPFAISDHLAWTALQKIYHHDLLPLAFTKEVTDLCCRNISTVQDFFKEKLSLENSSYYLRFDEDELSETQFINEILEKSGASLLFDINNLYVNSMNFSFDPMNFIKQISSKSVTQFHLGGHSRIRENLVDSHATRVSEAVWELFKQTKKTMGAKMTTIEWDGNVPKLSVLLEEKQKAEEILRGGL